MLGVVSKSDKKNIRGERGKKMLKKAIKKTAITKVLSCFLVFVILMSVVPVSVLASDSRDGVTGGESRDKNLRALGKGIKSPNPVCDLIGPKAGTTLSKDVGYTFIFRLLNKEGLFAEKGENARVMVEVTGGNIKSAKLPSSVETCFMKVIRPSNYKAKFYDYGGKEFKEGGIKGGSFVVVPTGNKLTVKITAEIDDVDGGNPSTAEKSLSYHKIAELSDDRSKALESLYKLASSRSNVTGTYIDMYRNFIKFGEPFKDMSIDDYTYNYVDQARFAGEFAGVAEVGLNWMVDPAIGMVSGFTGIINNIFGVPTFLDIFLRIPSHLDLATREINYHFKPAKQNGDIPLASLEGKWGALHFLQENQTKESTAWKNGKLDEVIKMLNKELECVSLSKSIVTSMSDIKGDKTGEEFFKLTLAHLEQESETISKLIKIADDLRPKPKFTKVDAPSEIILGEKVVIEIKGENKGAPCYGYLGLAFPDLNAEALKQNPSPVKIVKESTTAPHPKIFVPGNLVEAQHKDYAWRREQTNLDYVLVSFESVDVENYDKPEYWPKDNDYALCVEVEPEKAGDFHYEYKMVTYADFGNRRFYMADPAIDSDEPKDQQNEHVKTGIIKVTAPQDPPPTITITEPTDGQTSTTDTITVSGTASDNDDVSKVEVKVGSGSWQEAQKKESWSMSVTLAPGENTIYAKATDTSGQSREASVTVTYTTADQPPPPPTITITEPTNGQTFTTDTITVSGTASDNDAVSKVEVKVGSGNWLEAQKKESWSMSVTLAPGENTIYAKATDTSGQSKDASVTVTYTTADPPPTITITEPTNGQTFTTDTITVSGTASDNDAVSKVEVEVWPEGWREATGRESWNRLVTLSPGENIICARATDTSSNTKDAFVIVTYTPGQEPKLCTSLDPPSHDFGVVPKDQEKSWNFEITNCGGNTLTWSVSCDQPWIKVVYPTSDGTTEESDKVTVTVDTHGLSEGKTYTGHITVTSNGGEKRGTITVNIQQTGPKLCTSPDPPYHDFGTVPKDQEKSWDFEITNCGSDKLEWVVSEVPHWITVGTTREETTTETDVVTITIDTSGLPPGTHWVNLIVNSNGGSKRGAILVNIPDQNVPILCTSPDPLAHDFGTVPIGQERSWEFEITNCGSDTLLWDVISFDPSWISTDVMLESTTTETDTVTITIDTSKLSYGKHGGYFRIFSNGGEERGTITVDVSPPASEPKLCTSPDPPSHDFGMVPKDQEKSWNFDITNCGIDTLTWSVSCDQPWIDVVYPTSDPTTKETDVVTVTIDTHDLTPGPHTGQITIASNGGEKTGTITVDISPPESESKLCTSPDTPSHDFGMVPKDQEKSWNFDITNCGSDTLTWSVSCDQPWINVVYPTSDPTTKETDVVTVTIDTQDLSPGTHTGHITIDSNGGRKIGTITVTVPPPAQEPKLCTSPDPPTTNFGTVPEDQTRTWDFFITNCGSGTLTWTITCDKPWLKVYPASDSTTAIDVVTVTIDTHDLSPGTHTGQITIDSNGGSKMGTITVEVVPPPESEPKLCTSPDPLSTNFGTVAKDQTRTWDFFITNCGSGTLTWTITCDQPSWLNANPTMGSPTALDVVTVTIDTHDLSPGTHTGHITIDSNGGRKIGTITVNVPPPAQEPKLCTAPDPPSTNFGTVPKDQTRTWDFFITNCGSGTLTWTITCDQPSWLNVNRAIGSTTTLDVVTVTIDTHDLSPGTQTGHITLTSNGGEKAGTITVNVPEQIRPNLCTSPTTPSHDFGTVAKDQKRTWDFVIRNCGSGTLTWSVSDDKNWISVYPTSGSTTTERDTVTVTISTSGLSPGTHTGHITLTSNGGDKTGTITVVVPKPKPKPQNQPPENPTLTPDRSSPQLASTTIKWTASATDPDGDPLYYQFRLKGPATGSSWQIKRDWSTARTWTWYATASDAGETDISVRIRDGHHASKSSYDLKKTVYDYEITADKKRPTATIDSITPNPATQGDDIVRFKGHGYDSDGYIADYYWKSSKNGKLSSSKEFTKSASNLDVGTHTISFKVKDDDGLWSDWATMTLKIEEKKEDSKYVKFRGVVTGISALIGAVTWYVNVDEWISGSISCNEIEVVVVIVPGDMGSYDPDISTGDRVEVYGKVNPWGDDKCEVGLNGESYYYIKKI